jgi:GDP-L-fucose synthase
LKILIPGGNGFAGKNVLKALQDSKHEVFPLSRKDGLDLTSFDSTKKYFREIKPDIIINCSANVGSLNYVTNYAANVFDDNMRMLLNIFKAASEVVPGSVLINPVANCSYPGKLDFYTEDLFWDGAVHKSVLSYGSTRRMIIVLSECYKLQYEIRSINYFVPNMYGPFDSTNPDKAHALNALISKVVKAKNENKNEIEVWGSGIAIREWLFVKDFAGIVKETVDNLHDNRFSEPFNIGQNSGLSVRDLVNIIVKESGFTGEINWNRAMPDGAPKKVMDDARFRKIFPNYKFTEFKDGINQTINYYESVYPY